MKRRRCDSLLGPIRWGDAAATLILVLIYVLPVILIWRRW